MKLEIGKYYNADNGDVVGPMAMWSNDTGYNHPFEIEGGSNKYCEGGDIWCSDGTSEYGMPELISEVDQPVSVSVKDMKNILDILLQTRKIVCAGAAVGFNPMDGGEWAAELFVNNGSLSRAIKMIEEKIS